MLHSVLVINWSKDFFKRSERKSVSLNILDDIVRSPDSEREKSDIYQEKGQNKRHFRWYNYLMPITADKFTENIALFLLKCSFWSYDVQKSNGTIKRPIPIAYWPCGRTESIILLLSLLKFQISVSKSLQINLINFR